MLVREMTREECRNQLASAHVGRLACANGDQPYVVPVQFILDEDFAYSFSMPGQKLEWLRRNARVCLEVDDVKNQDDWASVVALGRYEELTESSQRAGALELLQLRPTWWHPGSVALATRNSPGTDAPVYFRLHLEQVTGRRGVPSLGEVAAVPS